MNDQNSLPGAAEQPGVGFTASRQQRALWHAGHTDAPLTLGVALPDASDLDAARSRLAASIERHEALRTTVVLPEQFGDPVQVVGESATVTANFEVGEAGTWLHLSASPLIADAATLGRLAAVALGQDIDADDPIQHADYADWQVELGAEAPPEAEQFWASVADGGFTVLPAVVPDGVEPSGGVHALDAAGVHALATSADVTVTAAWLGVWCAAVARLTGLAEVRLAVEVDARHSADLAGAAGPYCELIPVTIEVAPENTLSDLARAADGLLRGITSFQEWRPDTPSPAAPLVFGLGPAHAHVPRPGSPTELRVDADGNAALLGAGHVARAVAVLADAGPAAVVADIELVRAAGLRPSRSATELDHEATPGLLTLLAGHVARTPQRPALRQGAWSRTYAELTAAVSAVLARLTGTRESVVVLADRSPAAVIAVLACLAAGRAYVPLQADQPVGRLRAQADNAGASTLLAGADADLGGLAELGLPVVRVDPDEQADGTLPAPPDPDTTAYVIYTSGSTGVPKGVEVTHANLAGYLAGLTRALRPDDGWRWALPSVLSTDLGNTALFGCLSTGGTLTVLDEAEVLDPTRFAAAMRRDEIDAIKITPSHLAGLLGDTPDGGAAGDLPNGDLPRRLIVLGGERLPAALVQAIRERSGCRIVNHYGPTETTIGALTLDLGTGDRPATVDATSVPIGYPLPGVRVSLRTTGLADVPMGAVGELCIGGVGVSRGYRGDAERTASSFRPDPEAGGTLMYRTGDLARYRADGAIEFLGRADRQVKIRGYRVELGEVEAALREHPGVQRVAVVVREHEQVTGLAAYLVSHYHPSPGAEELRTHLATRVPAHMMPSWFTELDRLPLTPNGKLDVRALPEPSVATDAGTAYTAPQNAIEDEIATAYAELLGVERVGRDDDFFRLGGHSLLATQVVMRIRHALAVELPIQAIFTAPAVSALAAVVEELLFAGADADELADLMEQLEQMSEDEASTLLQQRRPGGQQ